MEENSKPTRRWFPWIPVLAVLVLLVGAVNFITFALVANRLGGDAINGKVEGNRYYVGGHGKYTQVSPQVFNYSRIHAISVFVTHPLAILVAVAIVFKVTRKWDALRKQRSTTRPPS